MDNDAITDAITFDKTIPLSAVSEDPLTFLPLERLFKNFRIVTNHRQSWLEDLNLSDITYLKSASAKSKDQELKKTLQSKAFREYVANRAKPERKYLLYQPLAPPYAVNPLYFIMNSPTIAHAFENKRYFRDEFSDLIRIPEHSFHSAADLDKETYKELRENYGSFVLQDEESAGSKGTYAVHNYKQYLEAILALKKYSASRGVVASKFIEGYTASVQGCITHYGIFHSGIQRQILDSKYLCNTKLEGVTKFCGGEVGGKYSDIINLQVQQIVTIVGTRLASHGYKGIFGVDLMITPSKKVYAIEINGRLTAFSHVIADRQIMQGKIPFMLLHVLELGDYAYEINKLSALPREDYDDQIISYLVLNNPRDGELVLKHYIRPGVYAHTGGKLEFVRPGYSMQDIQNPNEVLIFSKFEEGAKVSRGKRVLKITKIGKSLDKGELNAETRQLVTAVKKKFAIN